MLRGESFKAERVLKAGIAFKVERVLKAGIAFKVERVLKAGIAFKVERVFKWGEFQSGNRAKQFQSRDSFKAKRISKWR